MKNIGYNFTIFIVIIVCFFFSLAVFVKYKQSKLQALNYVDWYESKGVIKKIVSYYEIVIDIKKTDVIENLLECYGWQIVMTDDEKSLVEFKNSGLHKITVAYPIPIEIYNYEDSKKNKNIQKINNIIDSIIDQNKCKKVFSEIFKKYKDKKVKITKKNNLGNFEDILFKSVKKSSNNSEYLKNKDNFIKKYEMDMNDRKHYEKDQDIQILNDDLKEGYQNLFWAKHPIDFDNNDIPNEDRNSIELNLENNFIKNKKINGPLNYFVVEFKTKDNKIRTENVRIKNFLNLSHLTRHHDSYNVYESFLNGKELDIVYAKTYFDKPSNNKDNTYKRPFRRDLDHNIFKVKLNKAVNREERDEIEFVEKIYNPLSTNQILIYTCILVFILGFIIERLEKQ